MDKSVFIKEIFESIQGEGPYIGYNQLFIRFSTCNLHCKYCDTDFKTELKSYTSKELAKEVEQYKNIHSISLTGGEPLLSTDFLQEFLPLTNKKIYLETNGTLFNELEKIINYIDIISMDIKLPSTTGMPDLFKEHDNFIKIAKKHSKEIFAKVVFDTNITDDEINKVIKIAKENNILIILQPKMDGEILNLKTEFINEIFYRFVSKYQNIRLIPQVHKFLNVR